jgi:hypothetical protein
MQPQQKKSSTKPKSKVVAKKPTAQSIAAQRTAMIKKMKGDTAKPAAKKVMPKMKSGSGCVSKYPDGSKKVKPTSTAARRASTATAIPAKRKAMTKEEEIRNTRGPQMERGSYYDNKNKNQFERDVYQTQDNAREIKKAQQKQRDKALEKAVSGKMKSGTKKVKC